MFLFVFWFHTVLYFRFVFWNIFLTCWAIYQSWMILINFTNEMKQWNECARTLANAIANLETELKFIFQIEKWKEYKETHIEREANEYSFCILYLVIASKIDVRDRMATRTTFMNANSKIPVCRLDVETNWKEMKKEKKHKTNI